MATDQPIFRTPQARLLHLVGNFEKSQRITKEEKTKLKSLIFGGGGVIAALEVYEHDKNEEELLNSLLTCAKMRQDKDQTSDDNNRRECVGDFDDCSEYSGSILVWLFNFFTSVQQQSHHLTLSNTHQWVLWFLSGFEFAVIDTVRFRLIDALFILLLKLFYNKYTGTKPYLKWLNCWKLFSMCLNIYVRGGAFLYLFFLYQ